MVQTRLDYGQSTSDSDSFSKWKGKAKECKLKGCSYFIRVKEFILSFNISPEVSHQAVALADLLNMILLEFLY
jgi:hypothetical protein